MIHEPAQVRSSAHDWTSPRRGSAASLFGARFTGPEHGVGDRSLSTGMGKGNERCEMCTGTGLWYRFGSTPLPIRWVLTRDQAGKRPPKALFSTESAQPAEEIISDFMKRWSLETTFEESRAHFGIETQRQWSDRAIERTTPLLFGLYSLVALFGASIAPDGRIPVAHAAWYHKPPPPFVICLALVQAASVGSL